MEKLPTELWFMVFRYLTSDDLINGFSSLNTNFDEIVSGYISLHWNIQCLYRSAFQTLCSHLPRIHQSLKDIGFSDCVDGLQQLHQFQQLGYTFDRFPNLQSISLSHIDSIDLLNNILTQLERLENLNHLTMKRMDVVAKSEKFPLMFHRLWRFRSLLSLEINIDGDSRIPFPDLLYQSSTLKRLKLMNCRCSPSGFVHLLNNTPKLQQLSIRVNGPKEHISYFNLWQHLSMDSLEINYTGKWSDLLIILQLLPGLQLLQMTINFDILDSAFSLNDNIDQHMKHLRSLQIFTQFFLRNKPSEQQNIVPSFKKFENIVKTRNLTEYPLRYDYHYVHGRYSCFLYTIPSIVYHSKDLPSYEKNIISYVSVPGCINQHSYDRITSLEYDEIPFSENLMLQFSNLHHLRLPLRSDDMFNRNLIQFDRLISLELSIYDKTSLDSIQPILDEAIHLRRLKFLRWSMSIINHIRSSSVRDLDLSGFSIDSSSQYFDHSALKVFAASHWANQCVILSIPVKNSTFIHDLIDQLKNLQVLFIKCQDDGWPCNSDSDANDNYLNQLKERLPNSYRLTRENGRFGTTKIWIA